MSATLGPIHYRMYGRMLLQDQLVLAMQTLAAEEGWKCVLPDHFPAPLIVDDLVNLIDAGNIHAWLSERVNAVEQRFAQVLLAVMAENFDDRLAKLKALFYQTGLQYKIQLQTPEYTAKTIYELVHYYLLDGMPCDFPFKALEEGDDSLYVWEIVTCPHSKYYAQQTEILHAYYTLRVSFVQGLLVDIPVSYSWDGDKKFMIKKEERV